MVIPSQDLITCKQCGQRSAPHPKRSDFCVPCMKHKQVEYQRAYRERQKANPKLVICKGCGEQFSTARSGRTWRCQPCTNAYQVEAARKDRERHAGYSRRYRAELGNVYRKRMIQRRKVRINSMSADELVAFRQAEVEKTKRLNAVLRNEVFAAYGGRICACCGETQPMFLGIDHVENDGAELRKRGVQPRGGTQFYQWLRKNGFPSGYQVLCMNCNIGKHRNGGVCPHKSGKV